MGDRWYTQMNESGNNKPKRRLKADVVKDIIKVLDNITITSFDKMTKVDLETLLEALKRG